MTNFISIYVTGASTLLSGVRLIGLNNFVSAVPGSVTNTIKVHCGLSDDITITTSTGGVNIVLDAITAAISAVPGGNVVAVDLPKGTTVTAFTIA